MGKKILVVNDDLIELECFHFILEGENYDVLVASSGYEALEVFEREFILSDGIDLVILDIMMPGMDGIEVLAKLKERYPDLPVIICSGGNYRAYFSVWFPDAYLNKPCTPTEIIDIVEKLLSK
ncbi:MAG: response regulator [Candidatus Magnetobacterium sp. LHC-1]|nr:response regulator [Nitrospirota bacterium]